MPSFPTDSSLRITQDHLTRAKYYPAFDISLADLPDCLAFNPVRITPYGTLEIRSACQQPF